MELSTLSSPHVYHRISRTEDFFSTSGSRMVADPRTNVRSRATTRLDLQGYAPWVSARGVSDEGLGFCSHCRVSGVLDCGLDGKWLHSRRRGEVAGCWKRREWRCLSVETEANWSSESSPGSVHFVGVGGSGLSALALLALRQGWQVSGSDLSWSEQLDRLKEAGARVYVGHNAAQMTPEEAPPPGALVVSSAVGPGNEEVDAASALNVPMDTWLGKLTEGYELIAIAGTHGKSTTAAMLSVVLRNLGEDITAIVGAQVPQFPDGGNAMYGTTRKFVLEADDYDGCFLGVSPSLAVVTNVEWEHVDMLPDEEAVREMFMKFVMRIKPGGCLVLCDDSAGAQSLSGFMKEDDETCLGSQSRGKRRVVTHGLGGSSDWRAIMLVPNPQGGTDYTVPCRPSFQTNFLLSLLGGVVACAGGRTGTQAHGRRRGDPLCGAGSAHTDGFRLTDSVGNTHKSMQGIDNMSSGLE